MELINYIALVVGYMVIGGCALWVLTMLLLFLWLQLSQAAHMSMLMVRAYDKSGDKSGYTEEYRNMRFKRLGVFWYYGFTRLLPFHGCEVDSQRYWGDYRGWIPRGGLKGEQ